jgi:hypothetical protein
VALPFYTTTRRGLGEGPGAVVGHTPILKIKEDIEFQRGLIVKLNPQKVS